MRKYFIASAFVLVAGWMCFSAAEAASRLQRLPTPQRMWSILGDSCPSYVAEDESQLAEALWCMDHTNSRSDPNFWSAAQRNMPDILEGYSNSDRYLKLLGVKDSSKGRKPVRRGREDEDDRYNDRRDSRRSNYDRQDERRSDRYDRRDDRYDRQDSRRDDRPVRRGREDEGDRYNDRRDSRRSNYDRQDERRGGRSSYNRSSSQYNDDDDEEDDDYDY